MTSNFWRGRWEELNDEARQRAIDFGEEGERELLTPKAAARLFDKNIRAVNAAVSRGKVDVPHTLEFSTKVGLIRLQSAIDFWGEPPAARLAEMREGAAPLWIEFEGPWTVIDTKRLFTLREVE